MRDTVEIDVPHRHVDKDFPVDWITVLADGVPVVINTAGEGVTAYTIGATTRNPRVIAAVDAILWEGIVGLTHYEDGLVSISHKFAGIETEIPVDVWLDEPVATLERTQHVGLKATGGTVEFDCIDCGEHINRYRNKMDIPGLTPSRCVSCTMDRMAAPSQR